MAFIFSPDLYMTPLKTPMILCFVIPLPPLVSILLQAQSLFLQRNPPLEISGSDSTVSHELNGRTTVPKSSTFVNQPRKQAYKLLWRPQIS
jgi:hypothetical protein